MVFDTVRAYATTVGSRPEGSLAKPRKIRHENLTIFGLCALVSLVSAEWQMWPVVDTADYHARGNKYILNSRRFFDVYVFVLNSNS